MPLKKVVCIYIWDNPFAASPFYVDGKIKTFGSYQQAQKYIDDHNLNPNGKGYASPVEIYQPA